MRYARSRGYRETRVTVARVAADSDELSMRSVVRSVSVPVYGLLSL
ncbi:MAG: hypothetical protein U1A78_34490 [Polyangia bacterium]